MSISGRDGGDNTLPQTECMAGQPDLRDQDVLPWQVGSPSESGQHLFQSCIDSEATRKPGNTSGGLSSCANTSQAVAMLGTESIPQKSGVNRGYRERFIAEAFGVGRMIAASPTVLRSVFTQLREQELDKEHHRDR